MRSLMWILGAALLAIGLVLCSTGCSHNLLKTDGGEVLQRTSDASVAVLDVDGNQSAAYHGVGPTLVKQDNEGTWATQPGPLTILTFPVPTGGLAYIISPNDTVMKDVQYTPAPAAGEPAFSAAEISTLVSEPLKQHVQAVTVALAALEGMTKAEAEATVRKWEEAGKVSAGVLELLRAVLPLLFAP